MVLLARHITASFSLAYNMHCYVGAVSPTGLQFLWHGSGKRPKALNKCGHGPCLNYALPAFTTSIMLRENTIEQRLMQTEQTYLWVLARR